jgi:molybdopterin/thiamine biosynthesis adenylyltransferase
MKAISVTIGASDWDLLKNYLFTADGNENAAALLCGTSDSDTQRRILVRRIRPVPPDLYIERLQYHLEVAPSFYNQIVTECLSENLTPVIVHSHPGHRDAWYSGSDDHGEKRLLPTLASLLPGTLPASLVVTPSAATGRVCVKGSFIPLEGITVIGVPIVRYRFNNESRKKEVNFSEKFDRQIRAFGKDGQRTLESLKVGIVGVGGTGSLVAEQLVRAGVRDLHLIDNDDLEASNLSRTFGATKRDVNRHKVDVLAKYLHKISGSTISTDLRSAIKQSVLMTLRDLDLAFSCVDNDRTRALLSRFAHQYLIPVVDLGTRLDARQGHITAAAGRVSILGNGLACLRCSNHINSERIRAESMPRAERNVLQQEGYVMGIDDPVPAVVSLNTVIAGLGATAGINLFVTLTGGVQPVDQIYDARSGSVFPVSARHEQGCDVCDDADGVKALGDIQIVSAYD